MSRSLLLALAFMGVVVAVSGCAAGGAAAEPAYEEGAIIHEVSAADRVGVQSKQPIGSERAVLWVNGLSCPQCATNIDLQLERQKGVAAFETDLDSGKIKVTLREPRPSPAQLASVVRDAGFTLVKVEEVR